MIDHLVQGIILVLTGAGLWLTGSRKARVQFWGYAMAFGAQPFWILDTYAHGQWGMLALSLWLCCSFARGAWVRRRA